MDSKSLQRAFPVKDEVGLVRGPLGAWGQQFFGPNPTMTHSTIRQVARPHTCTSSYSTIATSIAGNEDERTSTA
jgi:hypothetical protein